MLTHTDLMKGYPCNETVIGQHIRNRCIHLMSRWRLKAKFLLITNLTHFFIVIHTRWRIDTIDSHDDKHWVARNM